MMLSPAPITFHRQPQKKSRVVPGLYLAAFLLQLFIVTPIYAAHRYVRAAKTAEAHESLGNIGRAAARAFARDGKLCASSTSSVPPESIALPGGPTSYGYSYYTSQPSEWKLDAARNVGFACLDYEQQRAQRFRYTYDSTDTAFVARATGYVDDELLTLELRGRVKNGVLEVDSDVKERRH